LRAIKAIVAKEADRLAALGSWPEDFDAEGSLTSRVPMNDYAGPGFDAGIACALDMIPRDKQRLSAILHAAYTEEAVIQVRREAELPDSEFEDSETCWWLAACSVCKEGEICESEFSDQLALFQDYEANTEARVSAARAEYAKMCGLFGLIDGVLKAKGHNPTSVDSYNKEFGLMEGRPEAEGLAAHHPLYDSIMFREFEEKTERGEKKKWKKSE